MFESIWPILQVILGIGLVIFVHEAGHFVAARWCKVRVHVFSLGFGPRLVGWTRGHTEYKISAVPLGGYVRMAGDESFTSGGDAKPWELGSKSVAQRFLIYSGGVIANVLFGLVVFPILFAVGIPSISPVVGGVERGSPAWHERLEVGTRILTVNGVEVYDLFHVGQEVAYSGNRKVVLEVVPPGYQKPRTVELEPTYDEGFGVYSIGRIRPSLTPDLAISGVTEGGAAQLAGLRDGEHFVSVEGQPAELTPREQLGRAVRTEQPFRATFEREGELFTVEIVPQRGEDGYHRLGITCPYRLLASVRESELTRPIGLQPDDRVLSVAGRELYSDDDLLAALLGAEGPIEWIVRRGDEELRLESPALDEEQRVELHRDLDLRPDEESTVLSVSPGEAAEAAGLRTGDSVLAIDGQKIVNYEATRKASLAAGKAGRTLQFKISRSGLEGAEPEILELEATPKFHAYADPGFGLTNLRPGRRYGWERSRAGTCCSTSAAPCAASCVRRSAARPSAASSRSASSPTTRRRRGG